MGRADFGKRVGTRANSSRRGLINPLGPGSVGDFVRSCLCLRARRSSADPLSGLKAALADTSPAPAGGVAAAGAGCGALLDNFFADQKVVADAEREDDESDDQER